VREAEWTIPAVLVVNRGPNAGFRFPLHQAVTTAGRDPRSGIFLDDVTISRDHAEFRLERGELQVVDIGSLNGTYVNGQPTDVAAAGRLLITTLSKDRPYAPKDRTRALSNRCG
jgi:pSer/pThr/pTyr-binding forkhead associated (FHA) protein